MKPFNLFSLSVVFLSSCESKRPPAEIHADQTPKIEMFSAIDSLKKLKGTDSLYDFKTRKLYVGKTNKRDFGFVGLNDSTTLFYQEEKQQWIVLDTILYPIWKVKMLELNGDNNQDLRLTYNVTGSGGNSENVVLLFDPLSGRFKHNKAFDLPNIEYNAATKMIHSSWFSGGLRPNEKMLYQIAGDSLVLYKGAFFEPNEKDNGSALLEYYQIRNARRMVSQQKTGKNKKIFEEFNHALWNSNP